MELFDHFNFMPPWIMQDGEENLTSSMHKALNMQFASNKDITSSIARLQRKCCMYALLKLEVQFAERVRIACNVYAFTEAA